MKSPYSKKELIALLRRSHEALEAVTERVGCSFETAVILTDCENALIVIDYAPGAAGSMEAAPVVH